MKPIKYILAGIALVLSTMTEAETPMQAPPMEWHSTSVMAGSGSNLPMAAQNGVVIVSAGNGKNNTSGPRKVSPGSNPGDPGATPVGDGLWVLLLLIGSYCLCVAVRRHRAKKTIVAALLLSMTLSVHAEGTESMANASTTYYYTDVTNYTGDNGMSWRTVGALDSQLGGYKVLTLDPTVSGNGISGNLSAAQVEEGIGEVSFYVKGITAGTGYGDRTFRVTVGSTTKEVTVNIPSNKLSYLFTATFKLRNVSTISITSVEMVSGETAKFGIYNVSWTSYNGKTDSPVFAIDKTGTEIVVSGSDTTWYNESAITVNLSSTTDGATFYYTTDGSKPSTSSASGSVVSLSSAGTVTIKAMAYTASLGESDVVSRTMTVGLGKVIKNDCSEAIWAGNYNINKTTSYVGESGKPVYTLSATKPYTITPVLYGPIGLSLYAYASGKTLTIAYQTGTMEETASEEWAADMDWKDFVVLSSSDFASAMKRFEISIPTGLTDKYVRFRFTSSGTSVYTDDINTIETIAERLSTPTVSVASGEVVSGTQVTLTGISGSTLHYSLNGGTEQTAASPAKITINGPTVVRVYASKTGYAKSYTAKAEYTVADVKPTLSAPTFSVASGALQYGTKVTITAPADATLHYSVNSGAEQTSAQAVTLTIKEATTISAYATRDGYTQSSSVTASYTVFYPQLDAPVFSVASGTSLAYGSTVEISFQSGASLHYRINGGAEKTSLATLTLTVTEDLSITAYVTQEGYTQSSVVAANYTVYYPQLDAPVFSKASGELTLGTQIKVTGVSGCTLHYSLNDGEWQTAITMFYQTISEPMTIKVYASKEGFTDSEIVTAIYKVPQVSQPMFNMPDGEYGIGTVVTISTEEGAVLHYTINDLPEFVSTSNSIEITITSDMTISAYATAEGKANSTTAVAIYTIVADPPTLAAPVFSLASGEVESGTQITVTGPDGCTLHYSLNDGEWQTGQTILYQTITESTTIKVYASKSGCLDSEVVVVTYTIKDISTGTETVTCAGVPQKVLRNGRILIIREDGIFDVNGSLIR